MAQRYEKREVNSIRNSNKSIRFMKELITKKLK